MSKRMKFGAGALIALMGTQAWAAPLADESFEGLTAATSLNGQGSGSGWSANWAAVSGQQVIDTTGSSLSYTFTQGDSINGGDRALQIGGTNNDNLITRTLASSYSGNDLYMSFLIQRTAGSSANNSALDDFAVWWLDNTTSGGHGTVGNIGVYDETTNNNQFVARLSNSNSSSWATAGGSTSTNAFLIVAHLSKGSNSTNANDYDKWELWAFDAGAAARSIAALQTPDSSGVIGSSSNTISAIGIRTANNESDDRWAVDELKLGTKLYDVVPVTYQSSTAAVTGEYTIDFSDYDAINKTVVTGAEPLFSDVGISGVSAVAANGSDVQNNAGSGAALYASASEMFILKANENTTTFGETTSFTIDFARGHKAFGVSFTDQVAGNFTIDMYDGATLIGSETKSIAQVATTRFVVESAAEFDRVVISGGAAGDGWGIDNILFDAVHDAALSDFIDPQVVDFESFSNGQSLSGSFPTLGLTVTATGGAGSSDAFNNATPDNKALFYNGSQFLVIQDGASTTFGGGQIYTLSFDHTLNLIGIVFADQAVADFTFNFFRDGELQAYYVRNIPNLNATTLYFSTDFAFDQVVISSSNASDGFGIDNITVEAYPVPTPMGLSAGMMLMGIVTLRRRGRAGHWRIDQ